jgi:hypothetical protein
VVDRRRMAAAVAADMPLGCIVRAERWMAGAHGLDAVCYTVAGLVLGRSWPWRRVWQCSSGVSLAYSVYLSSGSMLWWPVVAQ